MPQIYHVLTPGCVGGVVELVRGGVLSSTGGHPPHWHSQWQIVAVTRGNGWVRVKGTEHRTPGGSLFLIPPEVVHSNDVFDHGCDFRSLLIESSTVEGIARANGLRLERTRIIRAPVVLSEQWARDFDFFHRCLEKKAPSLELELLLESWIVRLLSSQTSQDGETRERTIHPAARRAREYLADHAERNVSLDELALASGLSRFELNRQFSSAFGMPPHAWQIQVRVNRAKDRLRQGQLLCDVAMELGFADQAHFSRLFKRSTGYSPGKLRSEFRKNVQDDERGK
ncbi:MAG: AraC family transcriptional regulator [Verrucomicrobiota bacterium]